jgi:uncharacterized tellurite resistance protein B-like protein
MRTAIVLFILLLFLTAAISFAYMWWQYQSWPPVAWAKRLRAKRATFRAAIDRANDDPAAKQEEKLKADRLRQYLHSIPMDRLADYPNIGPKTVEGLVEGGFKRIDQLWSLNWWRSVPGIGEVRAKALTEAAKVIAADATTKFENGQGPEAQAWLAEREQLRAANRAKAEERDRIKAAAERALRESQPLEDLANTLSLSAYLFHRGETAVTGEVINRPLPEMIVEPAQPVVIATPKRETPAKPAVVTSSPPPPPAASTLDPAQLDRMRAYCRLGFVVARADGRVAVAEKKEIRTFLADVFGSDERLLRHLDPVIEQCENPPPVEDDAVAAVKLVTSSAQREELMRAARRVADSSGDRNQKEQKVLDRIAEAFGIGQEASSTPATPATTDPRKVLEIDPKVELTPELIRRRFNILTDQYDPKKAASLGPTFVAKAEEMRTAVRAAAETLLAPFGVPLVAPPKEAPPAPTDLRHNPDLDAVFGM